MAFSVTDLGVTMTKGRGRNAVAIVLSFKEIEAWAKRMKVDEARLWRNSYGRACHGLKKKFADVMKNAGGVLADKTHIVAFKRNGYQVIGWPDSMSRLAIAFQDGQGIEKKDEAFTFWPSTRYALHKRGIRDIPRYYVHNPRNVIPDPFCDYVKANLDEWAKGAFYKELARQMNKQGAFK